MVYASEALLCGECMEGIVMLCASVVRLQVFP